MNEKKKQGSSPETEKSKKHLRIKKQPTTPMAKKKLGKKKILNSIIIAFLSIVFISGVCVFLVLINIMKDAPDINQSMFNSKESTDVLDKEGEIATQVGAENRENITYDQLPQSVIDAFLSIEDSRYFTHNGFDLPRFVKSALENVKQGNLGQGGSTLTMQMIDNVRKDEPDHDESKASSWQRIEWKIQEIFLSMQIEGSVGKEEILTQYLNKVNFGYTARGIQKGSQYYFGKDVSQLNLSESAFLAGVVNAPNLFNPYNGTKWDKFDEEWVDYYQEYAIDRRNSTLYQMLNHGYISQEEHDLAVSTQLAFQLNGQDNFHVDSSQSYLNLVAKEAWNKYGVDIYTESCVVYTGLDKDAQQLADDISNGKSNIAFPNDDNFNVGFSLMSKSGEITAVGAGRNFNPGDKTEINQALEPHQTGSTIKPVLDYAPGFDQLGYATSHTFTDIPMDIYGNGKVLNNADGKYRGDISFADTVGNSYNTTAAKSLSDVMDKWGRSNVVSYMNALGFSTINENDFSLQYAIGGDNMVSSPVTLAGAYAIFMNDGKFIEPHTIRKIEFKDGSKEDIVPAFEGVQTISAQAAYLMSDILNKAVSINYFMKDAKFPSAGFVSYGKTGTSDWGDSPYSHIPDGRIRDEWMVNYTSDYVVSTWSGYEQPDWMRDDVLYMNIPGKINHALLSLMSSKEKPSSIANPGGISTITHVKGKYPYAAPTENMPSDMVTSGLIKSEFAKLTTLAADPLSDMATFTTTKKDGNNVHLSFGAYPDAAKTAEPSHSKTYNVLGISFVGRVEYDPGFVFGRVVYRADVKVDGAVVQTITTNDPESDQVLTGVPAGKTAQICGYYAYEHLGTKSNEVCSDVAIPENKAEKSLLNATIEAAKVYNNPAAYKPEAVAALQAVLNNANTILNKADAKQAEVDAQVSALNAAIEQCKNNPVTPTPPAPDPNNPG